RLEKLEGAELNAAKKILADACTTMAHGKAAAEAAAETARQTFEMGETAEGLPTLEIPRAELGAGIPAATLFQRAGLAASSSEARKLIKGGGARLNDARIEDEKAVISLNDLASDGRLKLSAGKKRHYLIQPV